MSGALLIFAWLMPLLALVFMRSRWFGLATVLAPLPALLTAILVAAGSRIDLSWLLLGSRFGVDDHGGIFLLFSSLLWLLAAAQHGLQTHVDSQAARFRVFYLLAMSGNFMLILGLDLVSFYLGFSLMGLAAYGLVVHDGTGTSRRAGGIYLIMTLIAEFALLFALVMIYWRTGTLTPDPAQLVAGGTIEIALLILALGIKAGMIGLHFWLPLAHPAAPVPASAVLSGAMIKTALVGWIRYLPFGHESLPEWGLLLLVAGAAGALLAVLLGLPQQNPKVVLAYSSVGKMGTMVSALGLALIEPLTAAGIVSAVALFAAHHGLVKGALFLGTGVVKSSASRLELLLLLIPALALAGLPFTSGALAKGALSLSLLATETGWSGLLLWVLPVAAVGTSLLMARFLYLMYAYTDPKAPFVLLPALPWLVLMSLILLLPLAYGSAPTSIKDIWPLLLAALIVLLVLRARPGWLTALVGQVPPGDLIEPLSALWSRLSRLIKPLRGRSGVGSETV